MDLSAISKAFHSNFLEVIKFDRLIELIKTENPALTTAFIIDSLDVEREKLEKIEHDIPLIFVDKKTTLETINGKNFIPPIGDTAYNWDKLEVENFNDVEVMPSYDYQEWRWGLTFNLLNYYPINRPVVYASIDSANKQGTFKTFDSFKAWLDELHSHLKHNDIYILKRDALALVSDLAISDEDISLIKYNRFIAICDRSESFFDMANYEEFQNGGARDLAFEIWQNDKNIFEKIRKNENLSKPNIADTEKAQNIQLQEDIERLKAENAELKSQLQVQKESAVDSEPVLRNAKAYDVRERETHLLIIGALSNLLATNKPKYQKGKGVINQSAISKDIETEIIELLQPATKTRTLDTIRPRIRESINLITKAE